MTGRVPAEHRVFGLDRRTLLPALVVVGVFLLWVAVLPGVNSLLSYRQTTQAGDVFALGPGLTMDAQPGWGVKKGLLTTDRTRGKSPGEDVLLVNGGLSFEVTTGPYQGSLQNLLSQIDKVTPAEHGSGAFTVSGDTQSFNTDQGLIGLVQPYTTADGGGVIAALQVPKMGVRVTVTGTDPSQLDADSSQVASMISSITYNRGA